MSGPVSKNPIEFARFGVERVDPAGLVGHIEQSVGDGNGRQGAADVFVDQIFPRVVMSPDCEASMQNRPPLVLLPCSGSRPTAT